MHCRPQVKLLPVVVAFQSSATVSSNAACSENTVLQVCLAHRSTKWGAFGWRLQSSSSVSEPDDSVAFLFWLSVSKALCPGLRPWPLTWISLLAVTQCSWAHTERSHEDLDPRARWCTALKHEKQPLLLLLSLVGNRLPTNDRLSVADKCIYSVLLQPLNQVTINQLLHFCRPGWQHYVSRLAAFTFCTMVKFNRGSKGCCFLQTHPVALCPKCVQWSISEGAILAHRRWLRTSAELIGCRLFPAKCLKAWTCSVVLTFKCTWSTSKETWPFTPDL